MGELGPGQRGTNRQGVGGAQQHKHTGEAAQHGQQYALVGPLWDGKRVSLWKTDTVDVVKVPPVDPSQGTTEGGLPGLQR